MSMSTVLRFLQKESRTKRGISRAARFLRRVADQGGGTSHQVEFGSSPSSHRVVVPTLASHLLQYHTRRAGVRSLARTRYQLNGVRKANPGCVPYCGLTAASDRHFNGLLSPNRDIVAFAGERCPHLASHRSQWRPHRRRTQWRGGRNGPRRHVRIIATKAGGWCSVLGGLGRRFHDRRLLWVVEEEQILN